MPASGHSARSSLWLQLGCEACRAVAALLHMGAY